ncbi:hybrid sensor histidine kinase/response regulator [Hymenobacter cheonanensis]|uniref:hybrid sensor histidine kinase/response regulator n=1 Tax=Hymenobacter sp. CA2-7 TaxID=3063993 RepID=UPI002712EBFB|nr:hybrid sensor histidine kinase/response regulator [Hymenobacter sp. CA2-7]MDO7885213.1 ATP-binding protein [Hymenobacter sp. CA2-7]
MFSCIISGLRRWGGLLVVALLLGLRPGHAAPGPQAFVRQFGPAEGLAQPFIYCLLQDRQGYLWLGTAEGLVRYDGSRFVTLTTRDGLADNFVTGLWQDPASGALWATHAQGSRSVQLAANQGFRPASASLPGGPPPGRLGAVAPDTARLGAYQRRYHLALPPEVVPTCLLEDREGNAWLGTAGQGLWLHADRFLSLWPKLAGPAGVPLALASWQRAAWATFTGSPYYQFRNAGPAVMVGNWRQPPPPGESATALLARPVGQGGGFWVGTAMAGVHAVPAPGQPFQSIPGLTQSLGSAVTALAYAPGAGLWVGTAADGVYLLPDKSPASPQPAVQHFTTANGLLHNSITALLADHTGRVWVGGHNTGLAIWEPARQHFSYLKLNAVGLDASALAEDAAGTIWVGTEGQGLYCRPASGRWQHLGKASGTLPNDFLTALLPLPAPLAGTLLLVHPQGLSLLDNRHVAMPLTAPDDLLAQGNLPTTALAAGVAWVGTRTGQLRLDLATLARLRPGHAPAPPLAIGGVEVDGESRLGALGELPAGPHRIRFTFQGISLAPGGAGGLQYRYRLRGLADEWSHPSALGEAQLVGLGPGQYVLEAQVRRTAPGAAWGPAARCTFGIATPWWRTPLALALALGAVVALVVVVVSARERVLRRQKLQLEHTVRERTSELRQKNHAIEHINAELLVARDAAEASRRAKAQFLANMSHEIRTPMNAVIGLTNLLQHTPTTTEQHEYLTAIGSSSQNLLVILNDILDSSKMEAGKLTLEQVAFRLPEAVRGLSTLFRYAADSKGLSLRVDVAEGVPEAVLGDPVRLQQVLVNLVSNALKFTRQGGVSVRLGLAPGPAAAPGHVALRFEVQDTGIGIPNNKLAAIFEDFSQANASTTREFGGTGLGLSIARNLVQLHGGQLGVRSAEGVGSTFAFELTYPVAEASQASPGALAGPLPPFEPALRVLVAEDNSLNQLVVRKTLEKWNVHVTIADNGRLAVEQVLAAPAPFDAVLMDVQMPELDGYAATRALRQHHPDLAQLPIIGLTASVLPEDRSLALAAGMNDILAKPFEPAALYARLAHFTGRLAAEAAPGRPAPAPAAPPPPSKPPGLHPSWQQLEELAGGNAGFISQIVNTFLTEAPALEQVLAAAYPHDPPTVAATAHKLKGQVAYFGVPGLHAQLDELERSARLPGCPYCEPLLQTVQQQLSQLYPQLQERA